jgi:hypothetical protein
LCYRYKSVKAALGMTWKRKSLKNGCLLNFGK